MHSTSLRLPAAFSQIPPLPQALVAALHVVRDERAQRADLVRILSLDQGLTGLFLRRVNSAYYGIPRRITSLDEAVGYLGFETVQSMIFAISSSRILSGPVVSYLLERGMLWQHSIAVAWGSQWIARKKGAVRESEAYAAGLLHDVGKLVLDLALEHNNTWEGYGGQEATAGGWLDVERLVTGHDHAEMGAALVRNWNLPDEVAEAIAFHHTPAEAQLAPHLSAVVHVADAGALMAGIGLGIDGLFSVLEPGALDLLEWTEHDMETLIGSMQQTVAEEKDILGIRA